MTCPKAALAVALGLAACSSPAPESAEKAPKSTKTEAEPTPKKEAPAADPMAAPSDVAAPPADAKKTESGLAYKVLESAGSDDRPTANDSVKVHYTGWTTDGKMFDSSRQRGRPATFPLKQVIAGWTEGLQLMALGDAYRFWIPKELAYNDAPGKPAGTLVFDVELLDINRAPPVPKDVAAPPATANKTASGLAYTVLQNGDGSAKPGPTTKVTVHYSGWTTDGNMFDSSVARGRPASFPLNRVIKGWTEGLQLMSKGAKYRFWIPGDLAYGNQPGRPNGMLVFDVELLSFDAPTK
ncbi:MAG: FKBP-type peptidyl-prolyl cis-trans isomerase [Myxococcota bacterium]